MGLEFIFWFSVALVLYAYAGYPMALLLWSNIHQRPVRREPIRPRVTFIITAHNEEQGIRRKIENTLAQDYPADDLEIIVASDCSTDGTDGAVEEYAPRIRLVRATERNGKEAAQQLAVAAATGDILVFSDVATMLAADGVSSMVANFADPSVGCVSSIDRLMDADGAVSGEGAYVRYETFLRVLESRTNSLVGLSGSFFAARRDVCRNWAPDRQSDFNTLLNAIDLGLRGVLDTKAIGYYRNLADGRKEFNRKIRTVIRGLYVLAARPGMLNPFRYGLFSWQLASHKVGRWLVPFALVAAFATNAVLAVGSSLYLGLFVLQVLFYLAAAAGFAAGWKPLRIPAYFCVVNAGILIAWVRFARGDRIAAWTPSTRVTTLQRSAS